MNKTLINLSQNSKKFSLINLLYTILIKDLKLNNTISYDSIISKTLIYAVLFKLFKLLKIDEKLLINPKKAWLFLYSNSNVHKIYNSIIKMYWIFLYKNHESFKKSIFSPTSNQNSIKNKLPIIKKNHHLSNLMKSKNQNIANEKTPLKNILINFCVPSLI